MTNRVVGWMVLLTLTVGCATPLPAPPPPREVLNYRLEPGDLLEIRVYEAPELDQKVPVRPDGQISALPVGDLQAAGLTIEELDAALTLAMARHLANPQVTVYVRSFANLNVYVGGEVERPGLVSLRDGMTCVMAIFEAGGFRDTARTTNVVILRDTGNGSAEIVELNTKRVLREGERDLVLQPYDVVIVPRSRIASVDLFVEQYIRGVLPFNLNASLNYVFSNSVLLF